MESSVKLTGKSSTSTKKKRNKTEALNRIYVANGKPGQQESSLGRTCFHRAPNFSRQHNKSCTRSQLDFHSRIFTFWYYSDSISQVAGTYFSEGLTKTIFLNCCGTPADMRALGNRWHAYCFVRAEEGLRWFCFAICLILQICGYAKLNKTFSSLCPMHSCDLCSK